MTNLGERLKTEREKRGLSLHEIGMSLKINPKILKAIEDGDQQSLPAKTFLRGFVKSYAHYLRLDPEAILQMFQEEYGNTRPEEPLKVQAVPHATPDHPTHAPKYENSLKRPDDSALPVASNNRIYTILVAILLLTLIAFVAKMMDKYQKESEVSKVPVIDSSTTTTLPLAEGDAAATAAVSAEVTTTTLVEATDVTTTTTTLPAGSTTTTTLKAITPLNSTSTTTTTTLKPVISTTTTTTTLRPAVLPTTTTTTSTTTTTAVKGANTEVILEALNRVTIRFTLNDGQKWENLELNPDQVHTFRSRVSVQLEISDGGAVNVIVNGRDRGVPGTIGKPLKLKYP